ncbi:bifunctional diguanylate cyclase/phosphodiesterase [methane-oxidizing endosymbiont of Gigantopelta aegis]|uniref:bifunctional diguanylate cyclase/phosphodiesterase n=1 Tax=methane-oxidizing endosymbiont of Gigantopelta aegis TaxID=2794938 RepID=UPI0018DE2210|nr:GGDEF domain-containing protein [methane-oxidizing endosymbiont of Gigantopelta aegis]
MDSYLATNTEISSKQAESLLTLQRDIMGQLATTEINFEAVLNDLCLLAEKLVTGSLASVMLFNDEKNALNVVAAPSLPPDAVNQLCGLQPGPQAGSCGTAVFKKIPQYVASTKNDIRWQGEAFRLFAINFNVAACWSNPIYVDQDVVGSFALSHLEEGAPSLFHKKVLETCAIVASVVIKRQKEQEKLWQSFYQDHLTQRPNRHSLLLRLEKCIEQAQQKQQKLALLLLDLDRFKDINELQGYEAGDQLIMYVCQQIIQVLGEDVFFARSGGNEFAILLENIEDKEQVEAICQQIQHTLTQCYRYKHVDFSLSASMGVSIYPDDGKNYIDLLRNANTAMFKAKAEGVGQYCFYQHDLTIQAKQRLELVSSLRQALDNAEFQVYYQPQYTCANELVGTEALVRWIKPDGTVVSPLEFIPVAEQSGVIEALGWQVIDMACRQCLNWWQAGLPKFILAINLSVKQLVPGFAEKMQRKLNELGFPVSQLELEVTESLIMQQLDLTELNSLKTLGIKISMDDFGTGHSSLAQLKSLPISTLKIDRSFVKDIPTDKNDMIIAKTIITMGHNLALNVIAEGVETQEQHDFLADEGCDLLQGYYFSPPLSAQDFEQRLKQDISES